MPPASTFGVSSYEGCRVPYLKLLQGTFTIYSRPCSRVGIGMNLKGQVPWSIAVTTSRGRSTTSVIPTTAHHMEMATLFVPEHVLRTSHIISNHHYLPSGTRPLLLSPRRLGQSRCVSPSSFIHDPGFSGLVTSNTPSGQILFK